MLNFFLSQFLLDIWYWVDFTTVYSHCTVNFIFLFTRLCFLSTLISKLFFLSSQEYMPQKLVNYYSNNNGVNQMWTKAVVIGRKMFGLRSSPNKITKINWVLLLQKCAWHFWVYFIFFKRKPEKQRVASSLPQSIFFLPVFGCCMSRGSLKGQRVGLDRTLKETHCSRGWWMLQIVKKDWAGEKFHPTKNFLEF